MASTITPPFYPEPSEPAAKVADFVPIKLSRANYFVWRRFMDDFLEYQGLTGFIQMLPPGVLSTLPTPPGIISKPPPPPPVMEGGGHNQEYVLWKRTDGMLRRWILATLEEELLLQAVHIWTSWQIWKWLEICFRLPSHEAQNYFLDLSNERSNNPCEYLPLHIASLNGDWEKADEFISNLQRGHAARDAITGYSETALLIAVRAVERNPFVEKLLPNMRANDVSWKDIVGSTALHAAAAASNVEAAKMLVEMNRNLPYEKDRNGEVPLHAAAMLGNRETIDYLLEVTKDKMDPTVFQGKRGASLLTSLAYSGLYDIALKLLRKHPNLASEEPNLLVAMAQKRSAFRSTTNFKCWDEFIYSCVLPADLASTADHHPGSDIENQLKNHISCRTIGQRLISLISSTTSAHVKQMFRGGFHKVATKIVPHYERVRNKKMSHHQAHELVRCFCQEVVKLTYNEAAKIFVVSLSHATNVGVPEVIEEILGAFPDGIHFRNEKNQTIFQLAIANRQEKVFNLAYQLPSCKHIFLSPPDKFSNNALHLAGFLAPQQYISLRASAAGAALQMQRELQWFKAVERFAQPQDKERRNTEGKTPAEVFTETHKDLVKEGEQWMKTTASSCTIIAALIATGVFSAAINKIPSVESTVPHEPAFVVFAIVDALALFFSVSSILMFLSILTSRYAEADFLSKLPTKLISGLIFLFISIILMMVAFGATLHLILHNKALALGLAFGAALPVALFIFLQSPLLVAIIISTCNPQMFGKKSDRMLF